MLFSGGESRYGVEKESLVSGFFRALSTKHDKIWHCTIDAVFFPKLDNWNDLTTFPSFNFQPLPKSARYYFTSFSDSMICYMKCSADMTHLGSA